MTTAATALRAARELISARENWTQGAYARDRFGHRTEFEVHRAVCWCALGAVFAVTGCEELSGVLRPLDKAADQLFSATPVAVNERLGHAAVLRMYDRAIELAEAQA